LKVLHHVNKYQIAVTIFRDSHFFVMACAGGDGRNRLLSQRFIRSWPAARGLHYGLTMKVARQLSRAKEKLKFTEGENNAKN